MGGFPVVERLVAVLDWRKQGRDQVGAEKEVKRGYGLHAICAWPPCGSEDTTQISSRALGHCCETYFFFAWLAAGCSNVADAAAVFLDAGAGAFAGAALGAAALEETLGAIVADATVWWQLERCAAEVLCCWGQGPPQLEEDGGEAC